MNKKEIKIIATQEKVLFERVEYCKKMSRFYYNLAIKARKEKDTNYSKKYWKYSKDYYLEYNEAWGRWYSVFNLKYLLNIDCIACSVKVDKKAVAQEKHLHEAIKVDKVTFKFLNNMKKMLLGGK